MNLRNALKNIAENEDGSVMVFGAFGIIVLLMFMAVMVDLGMYSVELKKLKTAAEYMDDEVRQMLPYYSYADDYRETMEREFYANMSELGYSSANIESLSVKRTYGSNLGNPLITVELNISLKDTYHCIFLPVLGISELPVHVKNNQIAHYNTDKIYKKGMPFQLWKGGIDLTEDLD
ncbi:Tad domain-containing protein [Clostridium sp. AN503]|uniref:Tad domain-containing protein n=1 Tax=Clostridium sp. AN503 TaxID=3160598 RepID=UPI00345B15B2